MVWKLVTSGELTDLGNLSNFEESIGEGQRGLLCLNLRIAPTADIISTLQSKLEEAGVIEASVEATGTRLDIGFRKGFPWLAVIVAAVLALIVLAILIISWQLYKEVPEEAKGAIAIIVVVAIVVVIVFVGILVYKGKIPIPGGK